MIEVIEQKDELKNFHGAFESEYDILGMKVKMKPMKLQLQKESCLFISRLLKHVRDTAGIALGEAKDAGEQFLQGVAILGFLSNDSNLEECLSLFTESDTDWKKFIDENEDCYDMILDSAAMIISNFFLTSMKFITKRISC